MENMDDSEQNTTAEQKQKTVTDKPGECLRTGSFSSSAPLLSISQPKTKKPPPLVQTGANGQAQTVEVVQSERTGHSPGKRLTSSPLSRSPVETLETSDATASVTASPARMGQKSPRSQSLFSPPSSSQDAPLAQPEPKEKAPRSHSVAGGLRRASSLFVFSSSRTQQRENEPPEGEPEERKPSFFRFSSSRPRPAGAPGASKQLTSSKESLEQTGKDEGVSEGNTPEGEKKNLTGSTKTSGELLEGPTSEKDEDGNGAQRKTRGSGRGIGNTMSNAVRRLVSKKKRRFQEDGFDLDLTYITDQIVAMGFPAEKLEGVYRNPLEDVVRFFDQRHNTCYKVYNLCSERSYDPKLFHNRVGCFPFDDHSAPPFTLIGDFCNDVIDLFSSTPDKKQVAVIHCKAGKGRTGVMICCLMMHMGTKKTAEEALEFYGHQRTYNGKGVTLPSQRRYVQYYGRLLQEHLVYEPTRVLLKEIHLNTVPMVGRKPVHPYFIVWLDKTKVYESKVKEDIKKTDKEVIFTIDPPLLVEGDVKIEVLHKEAMGGKLRLLHFWFNTFFLIDHTAHLEKSEIDKANKDKGKIFRHEFSIDVICAPYNPSGNGPPEHVTFPTLLPQSESEDDILDDEDLDLDEDEDDDTCSDAEQETTTPESSSLQTTPTGSPSGSPGTKSRARSKTVGTSRLVGDLNSGPVSLPTTKSYLAGGISNVNNDKNGEQGGVNHLQGEKTSSDTAPTLVSPLRDPISTQSQASNGSTGTACSSDSYSGAGSTITHQGTGVGTLDGSPKARQHREHEHGETREHKTKSISSPIPRSGEQPQVVAHPIELTSPPPSPSNSPAAGHHEKHRSVKEVLGGGEITKKTSFVESLKRPLIQRKKEKATE